MEVFLAGNKDEFRYPDLVKLYPGDGSTKKEALSLSSNVNLLSPRDTESICSFGDFFAVAEGFFVNMNSKV